MTRNPKPNALDASGRRSYHHPDLRTALINATLDRVAEAGLEGLSFRELAKTVGVSHTAPRRHFADRDELIAAASVVVSDELLEEVDRSLLAKPPGMSELESFARTFLTLPERNPRLHRLLLDMNLLFRSDLSDAVLDRSLATFDRIVERVAAVSPLCDKAAAASRTIVVWSIVYGFALLDRGAFLREALAPYVSHEDVVADVVRAAASAQTKASDAANLPIEAESAGRKGRRVSPAPRATKTARP
jgi:AcrR family transcriptional regulator